MFKHIVYLLVFVILAILPDLAVAVEKSPTTVTGHCIFDGRGGVYCPEEKKDVVWHGGLFNAHLPAIVDEALPASRTWTHNRFRGSGGCNVRAP